MLRTKSRPMVKVRLLTLAAIAASMAVGVAPAAATGTLDQAQTTAVQYGSTTGSFAQTFTAGVTGRLDQVDLVVGQDWMTPPTGPVTVEIRDVDGSGAPGTTVLATASVAPGSVPAPLTSPDWVAIPFQSPANVAAGTTYAIVIYASNGTYDFGEATTDPYAGGHEWFSIESPPSGWQAVERFDFAFKTYVVTTPFADVSVAMDGPSTAPRGAQVTYLVTVRNAGPDTAKNVVTTQPIPSGAKFIGVTTSQGSCSAPRSGATAGTIRCSLGDLASGSRTGHTASMKITARVGSNVTETARAASDTADPNLDNNFASMSTTVTK